MPGQFVMLSCPGPSMTYLRRPFSVASFHEDTIEILYRVIGKGTFNLALLKENDYLDFVAPCGRGFDIPSKKTILLIAGGLGSAPLGYLAEYLLRYHPEKQLYFYYGTTHMHDRVTFSRLENQAVHFFHHSDDHGEGYPHLFSYFLDHLPSEKPDHVFCCGPTALMQSVSTWSQKHNLPLQVSLESRMACGTGACYGCSISTQEGMKSICYDGPVFNSHILDWNEICPL